VTGYAVLELVRLTGVTQIPRFKRKNLIGYVEYWNAGCGESRMSGVDAGKERKLLPMHTGSAPRFLTEGMRPAMMRIDVLP
jgi:hypothetical protein